MARSGLPAAPKTLLAFVGHSSGVGEVGTHFPLRPEWWFGFSWLMVNCFPSDIRYRKQAGVQGCACLLTADQRGQQGLGWGHPQRTSSGWLTILIEQNLEHADLLANCGGVMGASHRLVGAL